MSGIKDLINKKKQEMASKKAASLKTLKPQAGRHTYRILPPWRLRTQPDEPGPHPFWHDFALHWIKQDPNQKKPDAVYICADKTFGEPCDICNAIGRGIKASDDDQAIEALKACNSQQKYLLNILHRSGPNPDEVQVMEVGVKIFEQILEFVNEYDDITDLNEGMDIVISKEGTGLNTKYTLMPAAKSKPVDPSVMDNLFDLDAAVAQENETKKQQALNEVGKVVGVLPPSENTQRASLADMSDLDEAEDAAFEDSDPADAEQADDLSDDDLDKMLAEFD